MPQWVIDLLNNPLVLTAFGTAILTPWLNFLAKLFIRTSPPPGPVAYDARDLPDHPLLVSAKVHLADEELKLLQGMVGDLALIKNHMQLIEDRLDLLMRK